MQTSCHFFPGKRRGKDPAEIRSWILRSTFHFQSVFNYPGRAPITARDLLYRLDCNIHVHSLNFSSVARVRCTFVRVLNVIRSSQGTAGNARNEERVTLSSRTPLPTLSKGPPACVCPRPRPRPYRLTGMNMQRGHIHYVQSLLSDIIINPGGKNTTPPFIPFGMLRF